MRQGVENERDKKISLPFPCKEAVQGQLCSGFSRLVSSSEEFWGICAVHQLQHRAGRCLSFPTAAPAFTSTLFYFVRKSVEGNFCNPVSRVKGFMEERWCVRLSEEESERDCYIALQGKTVKKGTFQEKIESKQIHRGISPFICKGLL